MTEFPPGVRVPPDCPGCGRMSSWTLTKWGARYDCQSCGYWAWNDGPMRDADGHWLARHGPSPRIGRVLNKMVDGVPKGAKYVGRGSAHGNHFVVEDGGSKGEAASRYESALARNPQWLSHIDNLTGCDLVCFCAPERCHADILVKLAAMPLSGRLKWARERRIEDLLG